MLSQTCCGRKIWHNKEIHHICKKKTGRQSFTDIVLSDGQKNVGKKKNSRKRTNNKKAEIKQYVSIIDETDVQIPSASHHVVQNQITPSTVNQVQVPYHMRPTVFQNQPFQLPQIPNDNVPVRNFIRAFSLKWVMGTTVRKCYGCGTAIVNPPLQQEHLFVLCIAT